MKNEKSSIPSNQEIFVPLSQPKKLQNMSTKTKLPYCRNRGEMNIHTLTASACCREFRVLYMAKRMLTFKPNPDVLD